MKKFLLSVVGFVLCAVCLFSAVGCKPTDYGTTTTDTTKVTSNGGSSVVHDGYLYFTNGLVANDGETNGGSLGSIYKVAINDKGEIAKDATYTKVVDALVGYNKGSINIIGDFLYYTTPGTGENKSGEVLYKKTQFMRKNLVNGKTQEIYKTADNNADEAVTFAYYKTGANQADLTLVVYEATSRTLKGFKIGNTIENTFTKESVTSAVFSEKMGSTADCADNFVFYTLSADTNAIDTNTNRVYRISPDGSNETLINDNANLTLVSIRAGKLLVTATFGTSPEQITNTYAVPVTSATKNGDITIASAENSKNPHTDSDKYIVCRNKYDTIMYLEEADGKIAVIYLEGNNFIYERFNGNTSSEISYIFHTFAKTPTINLIGTYADAIDSNGYLVFTNKDDTGNYIVNKIRYTFATETQAMAEKEDPTPLTTSNVHATDSDNVKLGNLQPEIVGNYVYVFVTDEDKHVLMHRISIYTPEELNEQNPPAEEPDKDDLKIGKATLVGGAEI